MYMIVYDIRLQRSAKSISFVQNIKLPQELMGNAIYYADMVFISNIKLDY